MNRTRILSLALCAALLAGLLAGCGGSADSASSAASESIPSSTTEASTSGLHPTFDENALFSISGTDEAFAPCLGWGPGVSGCSLKSVLAAASRCKHGQTSSLNIGL